MANTSAEVEGFFKACVNDGRISNELYAECAADVGIRIRPFLFRLAAVDGGARFEDVLPIAAGIEMVQVSTLIIDDVLDKSHTRNGRESLYHRYGAEQTLALGVELFSRGLSVAASCRCLRVEAGQAKRVLQVLSDAHADIYVGQRLDLQLEGCLAAGEGEYLEMISYTTAKFIAAPLVMGAIMSNASPECIRAIQSVGHSLGLAYQIRDDILDLIGDADCIGKPVAGDLRQGKMRLPLVRALSQLPKSERDLMSRLIALRPLTEDALHEVIDLLHRTDAVDYCIRRVAHYVDEALQGCRDSPIPEDVGQNLAIIGKLIRTFTWEHRDGTVCSGLQAP